MNPSLLLWSKSNAGCVSKMARAFSHFSCSMALHRAEKCISECAEVIFPVCTCCSSKFQSQLSCQAFISPFSHLFQKPWEKIFSPWIPQKFFKVKLSASLKSHEKTCKLIKINNCQSFKVRFLNLIDWLNHLKNQQVFIDSFPGIQSVENWDCKQKYLTCFGLASFLETANFCWFFRSLTNFLAP